MNDIQSPQLPEAGAEGRRAFLKGIAASVALGTAGLAQEVLAQQASNETSPQNTPEPASYDTDEGSIDNLPISQQIEIIEAEIQEIQQRLEVFYENEDTLTDDQWDEVDRLEVQLIELENQKQELRSQEHTEQEAVIAEEQAETAENEATIRDEEAETAANDEAINEIKTDLANSIDDLQGELGS